MLVVARHRSRLAFATVTMGNYRRFHFVTKTLVMKPLARWLLLNILFGATCTADSIQPILVGDVDDNLNFDQYLDYQSYIFQNEGTERILPRPYVKDRLPLQILDVNGNPFSGAIVEVGSKRLYTGSDGKLSLFPNLDGLGAGPWKLQYQPSNGRCPIECITTTVGFPSHDASGTVNLTIPIESTPPPMLDLALLFDTTSNMCEQLQYFRTHLDKVLAESRGEVDVRLAVVAFKSLGDSQYDVNLSDFVDTSTFAEKLSLEQCSGGGPKKLVHGALEAAGERLQWRRGNVARMALLVGEFSNGPTLGYEMEQAFRAALHLRDLGVRVYGLSTSNVVQYDYLFRLISLVTNARYMWTDPDTDDETSIKNTRIASTGIHCYQLTAMDHLLSSIIQSELTGRRVEADPRIIEKQVGQQEQGVCLYDLNDNDYESIATWIDPNTEEEVLTVEKGVTVTNNSTGQSTSSGGTSTEESSSSSWMGESFLGLWYVVASVLISTALQNIL